MIVNTFKDLKKNEREVRREIITSAALKLFSNKNFRQVTVREIARETGVSPGTIYRYYKNLDDLFIDIFLNHALEMTQMIENGHPGEGRMTIQRLCEIYITYLNENRTFYQMMSHFMLNDNLSDETSERLDPIMRRLMDKIEEIIKSSGTIGDTRLITHALFSSLNGTMIGYSRYPGRNFDEVRRHTLRLGKIIADQFSAETV